MGNIADVPLLLILPLHTAAQVLVVDQFATSIQLQVETPTQVVIYTLRMEMNTNRGMLVIGEEYYYSDGNTLKEGTFRLVFDAIIVGADAQSWGALKARY